MSTTMTVASEPKLTENKFFSFETAKVQNITIDQLDKTYKENDIYGNPLRGIYHSSLIHQVIDMCNDRYYNVEIYDMFAAQNKERLQPGVVILPQVEEQFGERAVEAHILRRVFANIRLTDFDDESNTTNLAIAFHQKGIQVGFGNMVKICHNQCMLGASQYASTYGERENSTTIQGLLDIVKSWLADARHIVINEREKIEKMKSITVPAKEMFSIIGMLTVARVKHDTMEKAIRDLAIYPLNQSQISAFTEDMLIRYNEKERITVWDLYDGATNLYKATSMDIPMLMPQNRAMCEFLDNLYF